MSKHQKALSSPKTYPIERKERPWTIKPSSGPHPTEDCVPVGIVLRDILDSAENVSEAKKILEKGECEVDGREIRDHRFPVGIFDSMRIGENYFRVLPSKKGFKLIEISEADSKEKICRVEGKKAVKGGDIQLNLNDGRNLMVDGELEDLDTGSSIVLQVPENESKEIIELEEGQEVMITEGKNRGEVAVFKGRKELKGSMTNRIVVSRDGDEFDLPEDLVFPIEGNVVEISKEEL